MYPMICIDFGSAFTKVGIRRSLNAKTVLFQHSSLVVDPEHFCIPTLVARKDGKKPQWVCGPDATTIIAGPKIRVFRNWKSGLFKSSRSSAPGTPRSYVGGSKNQPSQASIPETKIAQHFFLWLFDFLQQHYQESMGDLRQIPVRLNVPAFKVDASYQDGNSSAESALIEILEDAGFCLDQDRPVVSEPESNAIGIFTEGKNSTWLPQGRGERPIVHLSRMFESGGVLANWRQNLKGSGSSALHRILVVDIGAFTTDLALLEFPLAAALDNDFLRPKISCDSVVLGIQQLDEGVFAGFSDEKVTKIAALDAHRREEMKRALYTEESEYQLDARTKVGTEEEAEIVCDHLQEFSREIVETIDAFLLQNNACKVSEVILTGGGNSIPRVCSTIREHILAARLGTTLFHTPSKITIDGNSRYFHRSLKSKFVRGASGVGGASVYFDPRLW